MNSELTKKTEMYKKKFEDVMELLKKSRAGENILTNDGQIVSGIFTEMRSKQKKLRPISNSAMTQDKLHENVFSKNKSPTDDKFNKKDMKVDKFLEKCSEKDDDEDLDVKSVVEVSTVFNNENFSSNYDKVCYSDNVI